MEFYEFPCYFCDKNGPKSEKPNIKNASLKSVANVHYLFVFESNFCRSAERLSVADTTVLSIDMWLLLEPFR